jgi:hypothetical protein
MPELPTVINRKAGALCASGLLAVRQKEAAIAAIYSKTSASLWRRYTRRDVYSNDDDG